MSLSNAIRSSRSIRHRHRHRHGATWRAVCLAAALVTGAAAQAATAFRYDLSFVVDTATTVVDGAIVASAPLPTPQVGSGQLLLSIGSPTEDWQPGAGAGETVHSVRFALGFSSIDLLPALLPLSVPGGFAFERTDVRGSITFSRTEVGGSPVGAGAWTLDAMRLEQEHSASRFQPSSFSIDLVYRGSLVGPVFGLFDTTFADLQPMTIAQGLASTDKCWAPGVCIPYNRFGYSLRNGTRTFDIGPGQTVNVDETIYAGTLQLSNPVLAVPEPASALLMALGGAVLVAASQRRRRVAAQAPGSR